MMTIQKLSSEECFYMLLSYVEFVNLPAEICMEFLFDWILRTHDLFLDYFEVLIKKDTS